MVQLITVLATAARRTGALRWGACKGEVTVVMPAGTLAIGVGEHVWNLLPILSASSCRLADLFSADRFAST
jgi:hypothetical protein